MRRRKLICLISIVFVAAVLLLIQKAESSTGEWKIDEKQGIVMKYLGSATQIIIPSKVNGVSIYETGEFIFYGKEKKITSLTIQEGILWIGQFSFSDLPNLKTVILPSSLTYIAKWAFSGCKSLQSIIIPNKVDTIDTNAFEGCTNLKRIDIPSSVKNFGYFVFQACPNLTIYGKNGSAAFYYAQKYRIRFVAI